MTFKEWPSITNHYQQKTIDWFLEQCPELDDEYFVITEKLHGANWVFCISPHEPVKAGSRTRFLDEDDFNALDKNRQKKALNVGSLVANMLKAHL